jgi:hypothetical protein
MEDTACLCTVKQTGKETGFSGAQMEDFMLMHCEAYRTGDRLLRSSDGRHCMLMQTGKETGSLEAQLEDIPRIMLKV